MDGTKVCGGREEGVRGWREGVRGDGSTHFCFSGSRAQRVTWSGQPLTQRPTNRHAQGRQGEGWESRVEREVGWAWRDGDGMGREGKGGGSRRGS